MKFDHPWYWRKKVRENKRLQKDYREFYFLPLYSLCSTIFCYRFFFKDSKSEIS